MIFYLQKAKGAMLRWNIGWSMSEVILRSIRQEGSSYFSADTMAEADEMLEE